MSAGKKPEPSSIPDPSRQAPFPDLDSYPTFLPSNGAIEPHSSLLFVLPAIMNAGLDDLCDQRRRTMHGYGSDDISYCTRPYVDIIRHAG